MRSISTLIGAAALAGLALLAPGRSVAETRASDPVALRKAEDDFARLQDELARVNAEIAQLKRSDRSVRDDYRLRDRMADAEALAQKLGRAEARLRALGRPSGHEPQALPLVPPPQESPQDGSVELEAKADLFADQASKLQKQADIFAHTAEQLRARESLRRRAGAWDRDPFAGLESSKRNLAASAARGATGGPGTYGGSSQSDSGTKSGSTPILAPGPTTGATNGSGTAALSPPSSATPVSAPSGGGSTDSAKGASGIGAVESPASKSAPATPTVTFERPGEQRLFLDPTAAAELRQVLAAGGGTDPRALERAAATLRARARQLDEQAEALRRKSHGQ
jgi:hypothetical protein